MPKFLLLFLLLCFLSCTNQEKEKSSIAPNVKLPISTFKAKTKFKIGVIGSGIGGASYIHFINQAVAKNSTIHVYEKNTRLGGRVKKDTLGGGLIEQGATLIHSNNHYLKDIMATYDLRVAVPHGGQGEAETLAIWDGTDFRLNTSKNNFLSTLQMLWAYGMSLSDLSDVVKKVIPKWSTIYHKLAEGSSYDTPKSLFEDLDLYDLTQQTSYEFFKKEGIKDKVVKEFVDCISRVNYHQDGHINAFTDMVSLAGAGMDGGSLLSVEGGNVTEIASFKEAGKMQHEIIRQNGQRDTFDIVVVACPLDLAGITLVGHSVKMDRAYQTVHANFIAGEINYAYFNNVSNQPQTIFTVEKETIPFVSIARTSYAPDWNLPIYKVFSRNALDDAFFNQVFKNRKGILHQEWKAYTVLSPMSEWPPFEIAAGLYYINAMESAVSAMETQAVAARNIANRTIDYMKEKK